MLSQNVFLRIEAPIPSNVRLKSAIVNCISPDCGRLRLWLQTRFDFKSVWDARRPLAIRIRHPDRPQSGHRLKPAA